MSAITKLEVDYLIAAVQSKFQDGHNTMNASMAGRFATETLRHVEDEVVRVIREWAKESK